MSTKSTLILDTECYGNFWGLGLKRVEDGRRLTFKFSSQYGLDFDREHVRRLLRRHRSVGFNSRNYDNSMIYLALSGATNEELKKASDRIIVGGLRPYEHEEKLGVYVPDIDHIDLFDTNPAVNRGLKHINGSMHHKRLQELPFDPSHLLSLDEIDELMEYCQYGDIDGTHLLFDILREPIELREAMRAKYDVQDLRSKSDAQVGETIVKREVERSLGRRVRRSEDQGGTSFRYKVPDWIRFKTPYMQEVLRKIAATDFYVQRSGKVDFPESFKAFDIQFDGMSYTLGIGGLHSTEKNRSVFSDNEYVLIDADVASQYPSIIMKLGLFPAALGQEFLRVYKSILDTRLAAKQAKDKTTDKGLKIAINGVYGKLGSAYSVLFAPHLMCSVTLTGQLSLLMLIEAAHLAGIPVVSGNTDGVVFRCPRDKWDGFVMKDGKPTDRLRPSPIQDIIEWWESLSSFALEFAEYKAIYNESVNTYIALKPDGTYKRKGDLANHWRKELPWGGKNTDYDPAREGLKKSPQMTICSDAALGYLLHGIPVERTISMCQDVREFVKIAQVNGGGMWHGDRLGKVVRFYWSNATDAAPVLRCEANAHGTHGKVQKSDASRPLMTLPDDFEMPEDIDFQRYIDEAYAILEDIGAGRFIKSPTVIEQFVGSFIDITIPKKRRKRRTKEEIEAQERREAAVAEFLAAEYEEEFA